MELRDVVLLQSIGTQICTAEELIASGLIMFDALGELFQTGCPVKCIVVPGSIRSLYHVTDTFHEERRNLFGSQKLFHVSMDVVLMGNHFSVASFSEVFSAWSGVRCRSLADFAYKPVTSERNAIVSSTWIKCG